MYNVELKVRLLDINPLSGSSNQLESTLTYIEQVY